MALEQGNSLLKAPVVFHCIRQASEPGTLTSPPPATMGMKLGQGIDSKRGFATRVERRSACRVSPWSDLFAHARNCKGPEGEKVRFGRQGFEGTLFEERNGVYEFVRSKNTTHSETMVSPTGVELFVAAPENSFGYGIYYFPVAFTRT